MEDEDIRQSFSAFQPELPDDDAFMSRLTRTLDCVEMVREQTAALKARNRRAVIIASAVGFIVGLLFSFALPYMAVAVHRMHVSMPDMRLMNFIADNYMVMAWLLTGCTSVVVALNAYEISLSVMKKKADSTHGVEF